MHSNPYIKPCYEYHFHFDIKIVGLSVDWYVKLLVEGNPVSSISCLPLQNNGSYLLCSWLPRSAGNCFLGRGSCGLVGYIKRTGFLQSTPEPAPITFCQVFLTVVKNYCICVNVGKPADLEDIDNPDRAPSVNLGYATVTSTTPEVAQQRYLCLHASDKNKFESGGIELQGDDLETGNSNSHENYNGTTFTILLCKVMSCGSSTVCEDVVCQTNMMVNEVLLLEKEHRELKLEIQQIRQKISDLNLKVNGMKICEESLRNDVNLLKFYTG